MAGSSWCHAHLGVQLGQLGLGELGGYGVEAGATAAVSNDVRMTGMRWSAGSRCLLSVSCDETVLRYGAVGGEQLGHLRPSRS